jgi:DNA-directed RNA polymerase specialized sigma24 family protein
VSQRKPHTKPRNFDERQLTRMRDMKSEGFSLQDIARVMGTSTSTVWKLTRAVAAASAAGRNRPVRVVSPEEAR